tara:strand:+ start:189 stop:617 length:429 start_codon:yes stop_codon:yes gene_type:complete
LHSAEIVSQTNSRVIYNDFTFTDNSKYIIINQEGQWTDSIGNYGSNECKGLIKKDAKEVVYYLDVVCELIDQNNVITRRKFERTGSEIERGVGISTIIDSTSKYKEELIGTKCNYAVNRTKDMVFGKSVCKISDELYKKLTE